MLLLSFSCFLSSSPASWNRCEVWRGYCCFLPSPILSEPVDRSNRDTWKEVDFVRRTWNWQWHTDQQQSILTHWPNLLKEWLIWSRCASRWESARGRPGKDGQRLCFHNGWRITFLLLPLPPSNLHISFTFARHHCTALLKVSCNLLFPPSPVFISRALAKAQFCPTDNVFPITASVLPLSLFPEEFSNIVQINLVNGICNLTPGVRWFRQVNHWWLITGRRTHTFTSFLPFFPLQPDHLEMDGEDSSK